MNPLQAFSQLLIVIEKNIKRLLSSKVSASVIIFGPLLMIAIIGVAFQSSDYYGIKVGVYATHYDDIANKIIDGMKKNNFQVQKMVNSTDCIDQAKNTRVHMCMIFPDDYSTGTLQFYVDYSRMNLVYILVNKISESISSLSSQMSLGMTQDLLDTIDNTSNQLSDSTSLIANMTNNAKGMVTRMDAMKAQLDSTNIDTSPGAIADINNRNSQLNKNIAQAKSELSTMKSDAAAARDKLTPMISNIDIILTNMNQSQTALGCDNHNSNDLTSYLTDNSFASRLANTTNPACSLIYTFKSDLESQQSDLKSGLAGLNQLISDSDSMQSEISGMESNMRSGSSDAQSNLEALSTTKQQLATQLGQMSASANSSIKALDMISKNIALMNKGFSDIGVVDAQNVIRPIKTSIKSLVAKKENTLDLLFPALILIVMMFVSILLGNVLVMREKMSKAYFRNRILPAMDYVFIAGTYITSMIITMIQVVIIISIGVLIFHTNLSFNPQNIALMIILASILFTSIGMIVGYVANSEETSTLTAILIAIIFMLFSNVLIPIESMSMMAGAIAAYTPFSIIEVILRRAMIFDAGTNTITGLTITALIIESVVLLVGAYLAHIKFFNKRR